MSLKGKLPQLQRLKTQEWPEFDRNAPLSIYTLLQGSFRLFKMSRGISIGPIGRFPFGLVGASAAVAIAGTVSIPFVEGVLAIGIVVVALTASIVVGDVLVFAALTSSGVLRALLAGKWLRVLQSVASAKGPRRPLVLVTLLLIQTLSMVLLLVVFAAAYSRGVFQETTTSFRFMLTALFAVLIATNTSLLWFQSLFFRDLNSAKGEVDPPLLDKLWPPEDNFMFELGYVSRSGRHVFRNKLAHLEPNSTMFYGERVAALGDQDVLNWSGRAEEPRVKVDPKELPPGSYTAATLPPLGRGAAEIVERARARGGKAVTAGEALTFTDKPRSTISLIDVPRISPDTEKLAAELDKAFGPPKHR